jgi:hypothetical protein
VDIGDGTQGQHLEAIHQPLFCDGFFQDRNLCTIFPEWLQALILLISTLEYLGFEVWGTSA